MLLNTFKWLAWLSAAGLVALVFLAAVIGGSVGTTEIIVTFVLAGFVSLPGWIIHLMQKVTKQDTV